LKGFRGVVDGAWVDVAIMAVKNGTFYWYIVNYIPLREARGQFYYLQRPKPRLNVCHYVLRISSWTPRIPLPEEVVRLTLQAFPDAIGFMVFFSTTVFSLYTKSQSTWKILYL
jgi:hypothetical protein